MGTVLMRAAGVPTAIAADVRPESATVPAHAERRQMLRWMGGVHQVDALLSGKPERLGMWLNDRKLQRFATFARVVHGESANVREAASRIGSTLMMLPRILSIDREAKRAAAATQIDRPYDWATER